MHTGCLVYSKAYNIVVAGHSLEAFLAPRCARFELTAIDSSRKEQVIQGP